MGAGGGANMALMQSTAPTSCYSHPRLIQLIQQPHPEHDVAVLAVHAAEALVQETQQALVQAEQQRHSRSQATLVQDTQQALVQGEQQLVRAQAQLQQTIPAQQEHCQLVRELQAMQRACWNLVNGEIMRSIFSRSPPHRLSMLHCVSKWFQKVARSIDAKKLPVWGKKTLFH